MLHLLGKVVKRKERLAAPRGVAEMEAPLPAADRIVPVSKGGMKGWSLLIQVRQAKLGRTNSGRSYIVKKSTYD
jgi:hypothetical protein